MTVLRRVLLVLVLVLALLLVPSAFGSGGPKHHKQHPKKHHHKPKPPMPMPTPTPAPTPSVSAVSYCAFATNAAGVDTYVYVQAVAGSFDPGGDWRALYDANARVLIAGNWFTFKNVGDAGHFLAPLVGGVSRC